MDSNMVELDQFKFELNAYDEPLEELRAAMDAIVDDDGSRSFTVKQIEKTVKKYEKELSEKLDTAKKEIQEQAIKLVQEFQEQNKEKGTIS